MSRRLRILSLVIALVAAFVAVPRGQSAPGGATSSVSIIGSVVDAMLAPLAGVKITLEQGAKVVATTTSDATGAFRFNNVTPGSYRVRATRSGYPEFSRDLRVPANQTPSMRLPIVMSRPEDVMPKVDAAAPAAYRGGGAGGGGTTQAAVPPPAPPIGAVAGGAGGGGGRGGRAGGGSASPAFRAGVVSAGESTVTELSRPVLVFPDPWSGYRYAHSGERYARVPPNQFEWTDSHPLSTFGADVDTASYTNVRRFLSSGQLPPTAAVRVEEFVNYFHFNYDQPRNGRPIGLTTEVGDCPWAPGHKLVLIGARAKVPPPSEIEGRNIVLLIDVSGSMAPVERLPLIKSGLSMFVDTLREDDRLAIVTYAGTSGVALPSTPARYRDEIHRAIDRLQAGGSTNGASGLIMAYRVARESFIPGGVNRVILATDGDFNVGVVNQRDLLHLIQQEKESGVFLSVFGVGSGNLKDSTMEMLADKGNGHYAYLDSIQEARRVLLREGDATLETVAKDVKFQVEFNPSMIAAWKLIGYENREMAARDFNDDRKDGGEMGGGHTVTVLYEVIPTGSDELRGGTGQGRSEVDPLKYRVEPQIVLPKPDPAFAGEWMTVKVRYKMPEGETSELMVEPVRGGAPRNLPLASAIAQFGLLLQHGSRNTAEWDALGRRLGQIAVPSAIAGEVDGLRELVAIAGSLSRIR